MPVLVAGRVVVVNRGQAVLLTSSSAWKLHKPKATYMVHVLAALTLLVVHVFLVYSFERTDPSSGSSSKSNSTTESTHTASPHTASPHTTSPMPHNPRSTRNPPPHPIPSEPASILATRVTAISLPSFHHTHTHAFLLHFILFPLLSYTPLVNTLLKPSIGHLFCPCMPFLVLPFLCAPLLRSAVLGFIAAFTWLMLHMAAYIVDTALSQRNLTSMPCESEQRWEQFTGLCRLQTFAGVAGSEAPAYALNSSPPWLPTIPKGAVTRDVEATYSPPLPPPPAVQNVEGGLNWKAFGGGERVRVLASDGPIVNMVNHVPELFRSVSSTPAAASPPAPAPSAPVVKKPGLIAALAKRAKERVMDLLLLLPLLLPLRLLLPQPPLSRNLD
ncbi:hypothetical protein BDQ17DRAFT_1439319 [Cyathus striatus]|nr:hypothetical protein BDQ17DRAFT_1439319 [Cyathus striatus]